MITEQKLRDVQDSLKNSGWRINYIPWLPEGKLEVYNPPSVPAWIAVATGFVCFFGGPFLFSKQGFPVLAGVIIMVLGLILLIISRFIAGRDLYGGFLPVDAICIDREVQEYEDSDSIGSMLKTTHWEPRILCEFSYMNNFYQVTPIIVKTIAFSTEDEVHDFLNQRIDKDGRCTLWINPENHLHTVFHQKPRTGPYTV